MFYLNLKMGPTLIQVRYELELIHRVQFFYVGTTNKFLGLKWVNYVRLVCWSNCQLFEINYLKSGSLLNELGRLWRRLEMVHISESQISNHDSVGIRLLNEGPSHLVGAREWEKGAQSWKLQKWVESRAVNLALDPSKPSNAVFSSKAWG